MIHTVSRIYRKELIEYKKKEVRSHQENNKNLFYFKLQYTNKFDLKSLLFKSLKEVIVEGNFPEINLYQFYSVNNNIRDLLIHGKKFCSYKYNNSHKCMVKSCKTCLFINTFDKIEFQNGIILPLISS